MFHFDHIHIICDDISVVGDFFRDVLGAQEVARAGSMVNWQYRIGQTMVLVRQRTADEPLGDGTIRRAGVDHLGLRVPAMEPALETFRNAGCQLLEGPTRVRDILTTAFFACPGGVVIELLERG